jgi:predicted nucleotidyltransferase
MIREGRQLPTDIAIRTPVLIERVSGNPDVVAVFAFGSFASGKLNPLSDLDFAVLLSKKMSRRECFDKHLDLIGLFTEIFRTEEIDLVLLNDAPLRFAYKIIATGKRICCNDRLELSDFVEKNRKLYLDFIFFQSGFDRAFLEGIGYYG